MSKQIKSPQKGSSTIPPAAQPRLKQLLTGPQTIETIMKGRILSPTLKQLINSPFAIRDLDPNNPVTVTKIANICSAWKQFFDSMPFSDRDIAIPSFRRFIDEVCNQANATKSEEFAVQMLDFIISLANYEPNQGTHDPIYVSNKLFDFFMRNRGTERSTRALVHVEENYGYFLVPTDPQYTVFRNILVAYNENPEHLDRPSARKCEVHILGFFHEMSSQ